MNMKNAQIPCLHCLRRDSLLFLLCAVSAGTASVHADEIVSQVPLNVGRSGVPGNLALVPSVEFPTVDSQANIGNYDSARSYSGYFDPNKCYHYIYNETESERHFTPDQIANSRSCPPGQQLWSGNYLNWATTQTIDPFRLALTGGDRVKDTPTETWVQKARHDRNSLFASRRLPSSGDNETLVSELTPASWNYINTHIQGLGFIMRFTQDGGRDGVTRVAYNPQLHTTLNPGIVYEVSVRVKVCDARFPEDHCKQYSQGWKPEGLLQEYSGNILYSTFGFMNDHWDGRNGGVLKARQKFIGPKNHFDNVEQDNQNKEWDPVTGVLIKNPDPADADATKAGIQDSGVINYLNKFGRMTDRQPKTFDPVSELYYTAIRYFRNQGNLPNYSVFNPGSEYREADGFPVITKWDDPIRYSCQVNAILGIGDVNTHVDHDIPQPDLDLVRQYTNKIFSIEGIGKTADAEFSGRGNSAYIAGLAYWANTNDIRPDDPANARTTGRQTVSTYWVDVRENTVLEPKNNNQYWLAAKYGGFKLPPEQVQSFDPLSTSGLPGAWWHTNTDYLVAGTNGEVTQTPNNYPRADNFYVASEADKMVSSLREAFRNIAATGGLRSGTALSGDATQTTAGTVAFQAGFDAQRWSGQLLARAVNAGSGALQDTPAWAAHTLLDARARDDGGTNLEEWKNRNIFVNTSLGYRALTGWGALDSAQQAALGDVSVLSYLRGDRSNEMPSGTMRERASILGDIVNSQPVYAGTADSTIYKNLVYTGSTKLSAHVAATASRVPMLYVGANDGMLHGFNANTGAEVYAFMPSRAILNGLKHYTEPAYEHRFSVDGEITIADVYVGNLAIGAWKTVLVGTLGRGGPGIFALDITNPGDIKFLGEKDGSSIHQLGRNIGKPIIAQVADGQWKVLIGNGPDSSGGRAHLVMIDVADGSVTVVTPGESSTSNGLAAVYTWDTNNDGFMDTAYAGDLQGNMWRFSQLGGTPVAAKLFSARDPHGIPQPITASPMVGRNRDTGDRWLFFGTGRFLHQNDPADKQVQGWYGVIDRGQEVSKNDLVEREILAEQTLGSHTGRTLESGAVSDMNNKKGWYINLKSPINGAEGERMVVPNQFLAGVLIGTTRIPDASDICLPSGKGFIMAINPFTGGRLNLSFFDFTDDGLFNDQDLLNGMIASGIGFSSSPNTPLFSGSRMSVGLDDGDVKEPKINVPSQTARSSWREITGN